MLLLRYIMEVVFFMGIKLKRSLSANIDSNYILEQGQLGIEMPDSTNTSITPFKLKIGDGVSSWGSLPYFSDVSQFVPINRTINGQSLSADISLTAASVGARPDSWNPAISDCTGTLPISNGGTGATIASQALENLGITYGSTDLTAGSSYLPTGQFYAKYK